MCGILIAERGWTFFVGGACSTCDSCANFSHCENKSEDVVQLSAQPRVRVSRWDGLLMLFQCWECMENCLVEA